MKTALKWFLRLVVGFLALLGAMVLVVGLAFDGARDYLYGRMERLMNQDFHDVDRIELYLIAEASGATSHGTFQTGSGGRDYHVYGRATLAGKDAKEAAQLWTYTLKAAKMAAMCHEPPYGIRMYSGKELLFESTVCWECSNFSVQPAPGAVSYYGFDAKSKTAQDLLALFDKALPYPKPPAKSE